MARLFIRIRANPHPIPAMNAKRTQPGDVVEIVEDTFVLSPNDATLRNGHYRIIDVPGVSPSELSNLMASTIVGGVMTQKRSFGLNVPTLIGSWAGKTTATKAEIDSITILRS